MPEGAWGLDLQQGASGRRAGVAMNRYRFGMTVTALFRTSTCEAMDVELTNSRRENAAGEP
jgi:hypothetical protein